MKFKDIYIVKDERFSIGLEEESNTYYISFPVANSYIAYEEYYSIGKSLFDGYPENIDEIRDIVEKSRVRKNDDNILQKPGKNRGTPA